MIFCKCKACCFKKLLDGVSIEDIQLFPKVGIRYKLWLFGVYSYNQRKIKYHGLTIHNHLKPKCFDKLWDSIIEKLSRDMAEHVLINVIK